MNSPLDRNSSDIKAELLQNTPLSNERGVYDGRHVGEGNTNSKSASIHECEREDERGCDGRAARPLEGPNPDKRRCDCCATGAYRPALQQSRKLGINADNPDSPFRNQHDVLSVRSGPHYSVTRSAGKSLRRIWAGCCQWLTSRCAQFAAFTGYETAIADYGVLLLWGNLFGADNLCLVRDPRFVAMALDGEFDWIIAQADRFNPEIVTMVKAAKGGAS